MQTLPEWIAAQPPRPDREWAEMFGVSRSRFNELRNGGPNPSKKLMVRIEAVTGGAVPVLAWFTPAEGDAA